MKYGFYSILPASRQSKPLKGFSHSDNHGNFLLFPFDFSHQIHVGTSLTGTNGTIQVYEKDCFTTDNGCMLRLYYR